MSDYSEMKATKVSKTDKAKDALGSITEKISKSVSSGTRKKSTSKSSSTKKSSTSSSSSSTGTKRKYTKRTTTNKKDSNAVLLDKDVAKNLVEGILDSIKVEKVVCSHCGTRYKDSLDKCPTCNSTKINTDKKTNNNSSPSSKNNTNRNNNSQPPKKPNNKKNGSNSNNNPGNNVKKVRMGIIITFVLVFLAIGVVGGFLGTRIITKNDVYEMVCFENGQADIIIGEDEDYNHYTELGVRCVAFGKDVSDKYTVTYYYRNDLSEDAIEVEKVDTTIEGIYYAVYKAPSKKYSTVKLIRNIIVERSES